MGDATSASTSQRNTTLAENPLDPLALLKKAEAERRAANPVTKAATASVEGLTPALTEEAKKNLPPDPVDIGELIAKHMKLKTKIGPGYGAFFKGAPGPTAPVGGPVKKLTGK